MINENETVREVCAEKIESFFVDDDVGGCRMIPAEDVKTRIDRILYSHEREMAAKDAEIARLKAALKPMMEVHLNDEGTTPLSDSICAVAEAKRIMNEGE